MPICKKIQTEKWQICIGDMRNSIGLYLRDLTTPEFGSVDATEKFNLVGNYWAALKSIRGNQFFDETNTLREATHEWSMRWIPGVDLNKWIQFDGNWYKILDVDDDEQRRLTLIMRCTLRGPVTKIVNEA